MSKGILLLACGHGNYGAMAAVLAASIKKMDAGIAIVLLHDGAATDELKPKEIALFDETKLLPADLYTNEDGSFNPLKARLHYYDLSPFDQTLSIDVDNIWLQKKTPNEVFAELAGIPFTIQNAGYEMCNEKTDPKICVWAPIQEVIKGYGLAGKRFYKTYGDFMYFEKSRVAKKLFDRAKKIFLSQPKASIQSFIGQRIPDELAFSIAIAQTEIFPHKDNWHATTYYDLTSNGKNRLAQPYELAELYVTLSMGGKSVPRPIVNTYNILSSAVYRHHGLQYPYQWKDKYTFLPIRKSL